MPDGHWYLPSGVPVGLNWRPTEFRQPVPVVRICSLCGLFPRRVTLLPCSHAVCERCLEGCVGEDSECPLDREKFSAEECHQIALAADKVLKLEVHCWNSVHGCGFVGPMSQLLQHFENECRFHEVSCGQCQARVIQANIPRHLRHECGDGFVSSGTSSGAPEHVGSQSSEASQSAPVSASSLTVRDVNEALTELKKMLAVSTTDQLAVFETKMNELAENMAALAAKILTALETKETATAELPQRSEPLAHSEASFADDISRERVSKIKRADGALQGAVLYSEESSPVSPQRETQRGPRNSGAEIGLQYLSEMLLGESPPRQFEAFTPVLVMDSPQSASGRGAMKMQMVVNPASFLIHSERKDVSRPSYDLTLGAWASFKKKSSNAQSHVYATSVVWNGRDLWFSVLLTFDSFGEGATYLNAYVKFYNTVVQPGQDVSPPPPPSLAILHPLNSGMALTGRSMKSPASRGAQHDSNVTSQGYVLYLSVQVSLLEEGGYVADNKVRFHLVVSDASR